MAKLDEAETAEITSTPASKAIAMQSADTETG
jgi:hypothetical protein